MPKSFGARLFCFALALLLSGILFLSCSHPDSGQSAQLQVIFLDLDGAEATLLKAGDACALIDTGEKTSFLTLSSELDKRGIRTLNYLFLSHPHSDHVGGALEVIEHYAPQTLVLTALEDSDSSWNEICRAAEAREIPVVHAQTSDVFSFSDAEICVLHPDRTTYENENDLSLVLKLIHGENTFLFTGDTESNAEKALLASGLDLSADVLKVAHHGSLSSSSEAFLDAVMPSYALISAESDSTLSHPSVTVEYRLRERFAAIYRTDTHGTITVHSDRKTLKITTEK